MASARQVDISHFVSCLIWLGFQAVASIGAMHFVSMIGFIMLSSFVATMELSIVTKAHVLLHFMFDFICFRKVRHAYVLCFRFPSGGYASSENA
mmetsp:Transcript_33251/g.44119  ORF Transcript_33251/g.44119 Transcript_33251/m.44119 type:complete len:94 (-) Transcript_33251:15-296(-)